MEKGLQIVVVLLHLFLLFFLQYYKVATAKPIFTEVSFLLIKESSHRSSPWLGEDDSSEGQQDWDQELQHATLALIPTNFLQRCYYKVEA